MKLKIIGKKAGWLRWIGSIGVLTSVGVGIVSPVLAYRVSSVRVPNVDVGIDYAPAICSGRSNKMALKPAALAP